MEEIVERDRVAGSFGRAELSRCGEVGVRSPGILRGLGGNVPSSLPPKWSTPETWVKTPIGILRPRKQGSLVDPLQPNEPLGATNEDSTYECVSQTRFTQARSSLG